MRKQIKDKIKNTQIQEVDWIINNVIAELQKCSSKELDILDRQLLWEGIVEDNSIYNKLGLNRKEINWIVDKALHSNLVK